jgi:hypothetical protein
MPTEAKGKRTAAVKRAQESHIKNLERALRDERTGLIAVARVFMEDAPDPGRLLGRLEAMVRQAERNGAPARTRDAIAYGHSVLARAREQMQGRPQQLFEPDVGHIKPSAVEKLTAPDEHQQVGLGFAESRPLGDVQAADAERQEFALRLRTRIIDCYEDGGAMTDAELRAAYTRHYGALKAETLKAQRTELARLGRLVRSEPKGGETTWILLERA